MIKIANAYEAPTTALTLALEMFVVNVTKSCPQKIYILVSCFSTCALLCL